MTDVVKTSILKISVMVCGVLLSKSVEGMGSVEFHDLSIQEKKGPDNLEFRKK